MNIRSVNANESNSRKSSSSFKVSENSNNVNDQKDNLTEEVKESYDSEEEDRKFIEQQQNEEDLKLQEIRY